MRLWTPDPRRVLLLFVSLVLALAAWMCSTLPVEGQEPAPLTSTVMQRIGEWGARYPNEVVFCWTPQGLVLPETSGANRLHVAANCPVDAVGHIHTHPKALLTHNGSRSTFFRLEYYRYQGRDPASPRDLCYLSGMDVQALVRADYEWMVVVVTPDTYCWWRDEQLYEIQPIERYNYPLEGQVSWGEDSK